VAAVFGDPASRTRLRAATDAADLHNNLLELLEGASPSEQKSDQRPVQ
jgi:hypothetical protein